jgi:hypothetical protein
VQRHPMLRSAPPFNEMNQHTRVRLPRHNVVTNISTQTERPVRTQIQAAAGHAIPTVACDTPLPQNRANVMRIAQRG